MRITRLLLARYGHFEEAVLDFDPAINLHIVLGPNEAGKSTALSAIADALFGFPHRTPFAFQHKEKDLRVGIGLRAADGRSGFFLRRKGRQDTLRDEGDASLPESVIAGFLAGAGRDRFLDMFGMDGAELRRGGTAILEGRGEVGASILQAYTGPYNPRSALDRLNEEGLKLYGSRVGGRAFYKAAEAFRTARQDLDERSVRPTAYRQAQEECQAVRTARQDNTAQLKALEAARTRLDRIRRTAQPRAALARHRADRAALGEVADLPADAVSRRATAMQDREILRREQARLQAEHDRDRAALDTLQPDAAILAEAEAIDSLAADLKRIEGARRDREMQRQEAARANTRVAEAGRRLGLSLDPASLIARMPDDLARAAAARAVDGHKALAVRHAQLEADWARASEAAEAAGAALASLAAPAPQEALVAAIEAARAEGRIDDEFVRAARASAEAEDAISRALAALPLWQGTAVALETAPIPLPAAFEAAAAVLAGAEATLAEKQRMLVDIDTRLEDIAAELAALLAAGTPPTSSAIEAARALRDRAWRLIHRHLEGGPAASPDEMDGLPHDLAAGFAGLIATADALADRRAEEAGRVASFEQLLASQARATTQRALATAALDQSASKRAEAAEAWCALWRPAGITPATPSAMREWIGRREAVLTTLREARARADTLEHVRARYATAHATLLACVPEGSPAPGPAEQVAPLLRAAERRLAALDGARQRHTEAGRTLADTERALDTLERKRSALKQEREAWRARWQPLATAIFLPQDASAEVGADALSVWTELDRHARDWRAALDRVDEMTADIDKFEQQLAACMVRSGSTEPGGGAAERVAHLTDRLAGARATSRQRAALTQAAETRATEMRQTAARLHQAEDQLAALRSLADADTDEALTDAIARAAAAADLDRAIAERAAELRLLDDGLSLDDLAAEAEGEEPETLPRRLAEIDERLKTLRQEGEVLLGQLGQAETGLRAMEQGQDAAEAAQRMQDAAAEAQDIAERYVRLRLAHTLLRAGIDRFRREQQAPLLSNAGTLFASLTGRRYARLSTEEMEDGRMSVVALRPDGTQCPADRLSEGARDQLYLALRLAAISLHAAHAEALPFIADDLLASFDDARARAALGVLETFGQTTQTILFTHHAHIAAMANAATMRVHRL